MPPVAGPGVPYSMKQQSQAPVCMQSGWIATGASSTIEPLLTKPPDAPTPDSASHSLSLPQRPVA